MNKTNKTILLVIFIIYVALSVKLADMANTDNVPPLRLPVTQLWSIEEAEQQRDIAYQIGMGDILNEAALLALIKQAWLGDKNALIQAALIRKDAEEMTEFYGRPSDFENFLAKNSHQLYLTTGEPLSEPTMLKNDPDLLIKNLAMLGHPAASNIEFNGLLNVSTVRELSGQEEKLAEKYLENMIKGGYHQGSSLADFLIFKNAENSRVDRVKGTTTLVPLAEHRADLSSEDARRAITEYYLPDAMHCTSIAMVRMAEAYQLGIGVDVDHLQSNVWARVSRHWLTILISKEKDQRESFFIHSLLATVDAIIQNTDALISADQLIEAKKNTEKLLNEIDFDENWINKRDPVAPMP